MIHSSYFNPRPPSGERPGKCGFAICIFRISIHAPRAGSDRRFSNLWHNLFISIHAPRAGSDQLDQSNNYPNKRFQSTPPERGATN